ncbi:MAG: SRPBCC family protein [Nocardioidaceae bacterium]
MTELGRGHAISTASPDAYFARWIDHDTWPAWSPDTEWVRVDGPVQVGTRGVLKPKGAPKVKFIISACSPGREYTDTTLLPGARLVFQHTVEPAASGTELRVQITMRGPLTFLWSKIMGAGFRESAQADLDRLVRMVEQP